MILDIEKFYRVAQEALSESSRYIRDAILGNVDLSEFLIKGDRTAVTIVDEKSQKIAIPIIQRGFPEYGIRAEEGKGFFGNPDSPIRLMLDPLDGTGGFLIGGPTPTVIFGAYDRGIKQVAAVATMEPTTGRFWFSAKGEGAYRNRFDYNKNEWIDQDSRGQKVHVSNAKMEGAHVLVDVDHTFSRKLPDGSLRKILSQAGRRILSDRIENAGAKTASFYTNGGHYALVANGNPTLAGCVTTAVGGPYDIAGIRHVLEAGGDARGYRIKEREGTRLIEGIGEDIELADFAIAANSEKNMGLLEVFVADAMRAA